MKTLRLCLIALCLCLFAASCGRQTGLEVGARGSLIRAANGNLYASECLRKSRSVAEVLDCQVPEESGSSGRGLVGRGAYYEYQTGSGTGASNSGYYNPIATFDPFAGAYGNYYGGQNYFDYNQGIVWDPTLFQTSSWNNFFQSSSTYVWDNDPYGWYKFLYGNYGSYNNFGGGYNSGYQGSSVCDIGWVNQPMYYEDSLDQNFRYCGYPWSPDDGYGYHPGYGGYYPQQGQNVFEMRITSEQTGMMTARYYLVGQSTSGQATYQIWKESCAGACQVQVYSSISKSKFDHILNLSNRITSNNVQSEITAAIACSNTERRFLTVQNGTKVISDRVKPCGAASINTSPYARRLEQAILNVLNLQ